MKPAVTVLIDTYNHERFIEDAIVSVLDQDFPAAQMEILVVDDGSSDLTPEIVRKFAPRVRYLRKENGGQASAFNFGIPQAQGEIVALLDGDDWWARNKVHLVVEAFEDYPHVGTVGHGIIEVDSDANRSRALGPETIGYFDLASDKGAHTFRGFMAFLGTSRVSFRKSVLTKVLPVPEALVVEADEFLSAMAVGCGGAVLLAEPLTFYRLHDANLFQFRATDPIRTRRKLEVLNCLAADLAPQLARLGVSQSAISIIVDPIRISTSRMKLMLDSGTPLETYLVEQADLRVAYGHMSMGYWLYKQITLLLALILPPRFYYQLKALYAANDLRRFRSWLGEPKLRARVRETVWAPGGPLDREK